LAYVLWLEREADKIINALAMLPPHTDYDTGSQPRPLGVEDGQRPDLVEEKVMMAGLNGLAVLDRLVKSEDEEHMGDEHHHHHPPQGIIEEDDKKIGVVEQMEAEDMLSLELTPCAQDFDYERSGDIRRDATDPLGSLPIPPQVMSRSTMRISLNSSLKQEVSDDCRHEIDLSGPR
jgi:hypothetical protein